MITASLRRLLPLILTLGAVLPGRAAPTQARIDELVGTLFTPAEYERATLAPDGSHLAVTREFHDHKVLLTLNLTTHEMNAVRQDANKDVGGVYWTGPDALYFELIRQPQYYAGDFVVDENLKDPRKIEPRTGSEFYYLVQTVPWDGKYILMGGLGQDFSAPLCKYNLKTRAFTEVEANPGRVVGWHVDPKTGNARLATVFGLATNPPEPDKRAEIKPGTKSEYSMLFRDKPGQPWRAVAMPKKSDPVYFDPSGDSVLLTYVEESGRRVLQKYDLRAQKLAGEPIGDPKYDFAAEAILKPATAEPVGLYYEADKPRFFWLDADYQRVHSLLSKNFPGEVVVMHGFRDKSKVIFSTYSDVNPGVIYEYDTQAQKVSPLITARPAAAGKPWAKMMPVWFAARDGYQVPAFLTLPPNRQPGQKVPMVALSHGGPQVRDEWGFNTEVQFLAALGYGVLQVNYRGSIGYGEKHELATHLLVHEQSVDDVADGLKWTVEAGFADPKRLVAYGGSYGGYISLELATRYPDLLAATVGFAGVYDWVAERKNDSYSSSEYFKARSDYYVDVKQYADRFARVAPVRHADRIKCPVLLMHGGDDKTVDISQTKNMAAALKEAGKTFEVVKDSQGIHGLPHAEERVTFYKKLAEFLLKNVPPDA